jgi:hypothetical protein
MITRAPACIDLRERRPEISRAQVQHVGEIGASLVVRRRFEIVLP